MSVLSFFVRAASTSFNFFCSRLRFFSDLVDLAEEDDDDDELDEEDDDLGGLFLLSRLLLLQLYTPVVIFDVPMWTSRTRLAFCVRFCFFFQPLCPSVVLIIRVWRPFRSIFRPKCLKKSFKRVHFVQNKNTFGVLLPELSEESLEAVPDAEEDLDDDECDDDEDEEDWKKVLIYSRRPRD